MTRVLSELLGAVEPHFSRRLQHLERLAGHPRVDIQLSTDIEQAARRKIQDVGLDANDTTGPELYAALGQRLQADEQRFIRAVQTDLDTSQDKMASLIRLLEKRLGRRSGFVLKPAVAKRILKANLPRKTMKVLGYRSIDSMIKHESAATLYAAAWLIETVSWCKRIVAAYAKLQASDFEIRDIAIEHPTSRRWQALAETVVAIKKHSVLTFKELGTVIVLPLPVAKPALSAMTTAVLVVHAINEIQASGTFLKLHQMQPHFGTIVQQVVLAEPVLPVDSVGQPVPWHGLQQFFGRMQHIVQTDLFEPLVAAEDLTWHSVEQVLSSIEPSLEFWHDTAHLGILSARRPVSLNLTDALLSHGNRLGFESRVTHYFRKSLQTELFLRYLSQDNLRQTVCTNLQLRLAPEIAI